MGRRVQRTSELSPEMMELADSVRPKVDLTEIRRKISRVRDLEFEIEEAEGRVKNLKMERTDLLSRDLPSLFEGAQLDNLGIEAAGNLPGCDAKLKTYYKAVLPKEDLEKRGDALNLLQTLDAGDLTTTEVVVEFQRGQQILADKLCSYMDKHNIPYSRDTGVHWMTLTAWVRNRFENKQPLSQKDLATLGAQVGKIVELKMRRRT